MKKKEENLFEREEGNADMTSGGKFMKAIGEKRAHWEEKGFLRT